jgi:hypothetical protein
MRELGVKHKEHQTMTIDTTQAAISPSGLPHTGPLVLSVPESFSMLVEVVDHTAEQECVTVPGVLLSDPEFANGYYWGRCAYFSETHRVVDQEGNPIRTQEQLATVRDVKVRDVTDQHVTNLMIDLFYGSDQTVAAAWQAGWAFGYAQACVEAASQHKACE